MVKVSLNNSLEKGYPLLHFILKCVGLHLQATQKDGSQKIVRFNLLMFLTFTVFITCYLGYLINLLVKNWSYDVFLGNFKDALNMIYLLSVYYLVFYKRRITNKFLSKLSLFGLPKFKWYIKTFVLVAGVTHSVSAMYLCLKVQNTVGKCIMYTTVTYSIPFLVDIQIMIYIGSLIHAYRMVKFQLKNYPIQMSKVSHAAQPAKVPHKDVINFIKSYPGDTLSNIMSEYQPLKIHQNVLIHKEACWYLIHLNTLLNKVSLMAYNLINDDVQ